MHRCLALGVGLVVLRRNDLPREAVGARGPRNRWLRPCAGP